MKNIIWTHKTHHDGSIQRLEVVDDIKRPGMLKMVGSWDNDNFTKKYTVRYGKDNQEFLREVATGETK